MFSDSVFVVVFVVVVVVIVVFWCGVWYFTRRMRCHV